jgi:hypothetical protein
MLSLALDVSVLVIFLVLHADRSARVATRKTRRILLKY